MKGSLLARLALVMIAGAGLSACASTPVSPRYSRREPAPTTRPQARTAPTPPGTSYKVGKPYQVAGIWYTPREEPDYDEVGIASWYGDAFQLRPTASGELFDMYMPSAAHKTLPLPSIVEVTNLENGRRIQVRINDRGPFVEGRIIDLSKAAAEDLGMLRSGVARVRVRYVGPGNAPPQPPVIYASGKSAPAPAAAPAPTPVSYSADPIAALISAQSELPF
jgi:rare lipoprotein A